MAFTLQLDDGSVAGANAYLDAADFKSYHDDRGNDYSAYTDPQIQAAIVEATDYVDFRWRGRFVGSQLSLEQRTSWPRTDAITRDGFDVSLSLPAALKDAVAEYALRALAAELAPDPAASATGRPVIRDLTKVGPVTTEVEYAEGAGARVTRSYPAADRLLGPLLRPGNRVVRG